MTLCNDGQGASQKLEHQRYSLLILDFHMPHRTGLQIIRELRLKGDVIPIILMSAGMHPTDLKKLGGLERVACYAKTTLMTEVIKAVDELARAFLVDRPEEQEQVSPVEPSEKSDDVSGDPEEPRPGG